jgi:hypothetical protein
MVTANSILLSLAMLLAATTMAFGRAKVTLSGTAINTTNPDLPTAAPITFLIGNGECSLAVSFPLTGSGICHVKKYDSTSGSLEIISDGPPVISWTGNIKGNFALTNETFGPSRRRH